MIQASYDNSLSQSKGNCFRFVVDSSASEGYDISMNITFFGAARTVTGSCTMVECAGKRILVDCGLPQGNDEKKLGLELPFNAEHIDFVLITHAHIDHSGRIPLLVKNGFKGRILCTTATLDLCSIMLVDSGHIQEMEVEWLNRKRRRAGKTEVDPLYSIADARHSLEFFEGFPYGEKRRIADGIEVEFVDAGHLLGSSSIQLWLTEDKEKRHLVFSGDIGNLDQPIINDPSCLTDADFVIVESTYGDRVHPQPAHKTQIISTEERSAELASIISETFKRGGNVIIPSFAVGRTQELLYLLRVIITHNLLPHLPEIPVFLDSPLAIEATKVYSRNIEGYFDEEAMELVKKGVNPLTFPSLTTTVTAEESRELNFRKESAVVISASGMCEAGRIKHHLKHNLWRPESTIVFCGYQAGGTLGRSILDGAERVTIFGEQIDVKAEIRKLEGISAHADQSGLMKWLGCFGDKPQQIFVVHGEERVAEWFAGFVTKNLGIAAWAPEPQESFDLLAERLPVASEHPIAKPGAQELETAYNELTAALAGLDAIVARLRRHGEELTASDGVRNTLRLAGAISRFAEDVESLQGKWNSQGENEN